MHNKIEYITKIKPNSNLEAWYDEGDKKHFWIQWRFESFLKQLVNIKEIIPEKLLVMDVGCGRGVLCEQMIKKSSWKIDLCDINEEALKKIIKKNGRILLYDITECNKSMRELYDAIIIFDVIEHVENEEIFLKAVLFHLKPDGIIFINVPAFNMLYSKYDQAVGHFRRYTIESLNSVLLKMPVLLVDIRYWGILLFPFAILRKLFYTVGLWRTNNRNDIISHGWQNPKSQFLQFVFKLLMKIELKLTKKACLGTSILCIAKKNKDGT